VFGKEHKGQSSSILQRLGVVIEYSRRFQWNMNLEHYAALDYFRNAKFKSIVFPILWNDDVSNEFVTNRMDFNKEAENL